MEKRRYCAAFSVNNGDVLRDAAVAGLGLVVLPTFGVGERLRRAR